MKKSVKIDENNNIELSKKLSKVLRHKAVALGLQMEKDGFVDLADVSNLKLMKNINATEIKICKVVQECPKQRFELRRAPTGQLRIRASQGHSIKSIDDEELLTPIFNGSEYPTCFHGTYYSNWKYIQEEGLDRINRKHIHFVSSFDAVSGARANINLRVYIDLAKAIKEMKFYVSSNHVILSEGIDGKIPTRFFSRVEYLNKLTEEWEKIPVNKIS